MSYSLLIFDFDGTLADTMGWFQQLMDLAAESHGFARIDPARVDEYRGLDARTLMKRLGIPLWKVPSITATMRREMTRHIDQVRLFDGVERLLMDLRKIGVRTAIVSSNSRVNVERVLGPKFAAMIDHFDCGASIFGKRKHLRATLEAIPTPRDKVLCIGDEIRDAEAAASLGLDFAGVGWGYATVAALAPHSRHPVARELGDLLALARGG
jgi:phosphoglycolate phosphatase